MPELKCDLCEKDISRSSVQLDYAAGQKKQLCLECYGNGLFWAARQARQEQILNKAHALASRRAKEEKPCQCPACHGHGRWNDEGVFVICSCSAGDVYRPHHTTIVPKD